jgi:sigma-E factor negative regulatory protein RseC
MIEERATVAAVEEGYVWLETQRRSACGGCQASGGCGTAALAKIWPGRRSRVRAISDMGLQPGDEVMVGLAEGALLRGALLVYLLPLALLLAGAVLGQTVFAGAGEEPVVALGLVGLGLGFLAVRVLSRRLQSDQRFQPVVLRRADAPMRQPPSETCLPRPE